MILYLSLFFIFGREGYGGMGVFYPNTTPVEIMLSNKYTILLYKTMSGPKFDSATIALRNHELNMAHILSRSNHFVEFRNLMLEYLRTCEMAADTYTLHHYNVYDDTFRRSEDRRQNGEIFVEKVDSMPTFTPFHISNADPKGRRI